MRRQWYRRGAEDEGDEGGEGATVVFNYMVFELGAEEDEALRESEEGDDGDEDGEEDCVHFGDGLLYRSGISSGWCVL